MSVARSGVVRWIGGGDFIGSARYDGKRFRRKKLFGGQERTMATSLNGEEWMAVLERLSKSLPSEGPPVRLCLIGSAACLFGKMFRPPWPRPTPPSTAGSVSRSQGSSCSAETFSPSKPWRPRLAADPYARFTEVCRSAVCMAKRVKEDAKVVSPEGRVPTAKNSPGHGNLGGHSAATVSRSLVNSLRRAQRANPTR